MAKKDPTFEELIAMVDKLPNDMPQDYSYRKKGKQKKTEERAPVKVNAPSAVESKISATVNNLMETNNKFQTTQNTITNQQLETNKDQLQEDRKQTGLLQQQQSILTDVSNTMSKLYLMMKRQAEKLTPKIQEKAQRKEPTVSPLNQNQNQNNDGMTGLFGELTDMIGGKKRRRPIKPSRQKRADARRQNRARGGGTPSGKNPFSARLGGPASASFFSKVKTAGKGAWEAVKKTKGSKWAKLGAGAAASGAAVWGGSELLKGGFGSVAEKYESGGRGVGTISTGRGDHGGVSYGKHQLSTKSGTMNTFLNSPEAQQFAPYFEGLTPGSAEFNSVYSKIAKDMPEFEIAQKRFIERTHYEPAMEKLQKNGIDFSERSRALNELVFSTSVQYGASGANSKIMRALEGQDVSKLTDAQLIELIQNDKGANVGTDFKSSSYEVQQSVAARTQREKADLLAMLQAEEDAAKGIDREYLNSVRGDNKEGEVVAEVQPATIDGTTIVSANEAPVGIFPIGEVKPSTDPTTAALALGGAAAVTTGAVVANKRRGAMPIDGMKGKEAIPVKPSVTEGIKGSADDAVKAGAKGATKGMLKGAPVIGTVLTAAEAVSIATDDTMTGKEKARAGTGLAGGTAGAIVGAKAGAVGGAALGTIIFPGVGTAVGGAIGGLAGSIGGYFGGEYIAEEGFDVIDGAVSQKDNAPAFDPSVTPPVSLLAPGKQADATVVADKPTATPLVAGETKLLVVPVPTAPKVETKSPASNIASVPKKTEPVLAEQEPLVVNRGNTPVAVQPASAASVPKAQVASTQKMIQQSPVASNVAPLMQSPVEEVSPISTPTVSLAPKHTQASWSSLPQATPQKVAEVSTQHDTPMQREAFTSVTPVDVQNPTSTTSVSGNPQRIQGSGVAESNSVRPELKDVAPMITDFGIIFINTGII